MKQLLLNLGSNVRPEYHLRMAAKTLRKTWPDICFSKVYESPAAGFDGPAFLNAGASLYCDWPLSKIIQYLRQIEADFQRERNRDNRFSNRSLDIDLLTQGDLVCATGEITLPRKDILRYNFFLQPLCDLVPDDLHPKLQQSYTDLLEQLPEQPPLRLTDIVL